jgi:hypothetical protein
VAIELYALRRDAERWAQAAHQAVLESGRGGWRRDLS